MHPSALHPDTELRAELLSHGLLGAEQGAEQAVGSPTRALHTARPTPLQTKILSPPFPKVDPNAGPRGRYSPASRSWEPRAGGEQQALYNTEWNITAAARMSKRTADVGHRLQFRAAEGGGG